MILLEKYNLLIVLVHSHLAFFNTAPGDNHLPYVIGQTPPAPPPGFHIAGVQAVDSKLSLGLKCRGNFDIFPGQDFQIFYGDINKGEFLGCSFRVFYAPNVT